VLDLRTTPRSAALDILREGARPLETTQPGAAREAADILIAGFDRKERSAAVLPRD
jgi:hypothetical protein